MIWPAIEPIASKRVLLEPLAAEHAAEMMTVLADPSLYEFIGGRPPTLEQLQRRYAAQMIGHSEDDAQWWLNWIVALPEHPRLIGYVQATVEHRPDALEANVAWVISPHFQGRGLASEAASAMTRWLTAAGVDRYVAYIHPNHAASAAVARRQGLCPTDVIEDNEVRWQSLDDG
ncbi:MAG: GNAT family N-acetyltransferase [Geodermatophilaceae bacterium]|jgi:RimJ/RimL family protein N-acetyltransferase|nr:GNAT family N-acetyltransferase [Geodermatophilaceae bacterium]